MKASNLYNFEKQDSDIKKGVLTKEPDHQMRIEEEDLIKMNLDIAIIDHQDIDEDDDIVDCALETLGQITEKPKLQDSDDSVDICIEEWDNNENIIEQVEQYQSWRLVNSEIS